MFRTSVTLFLVRLFFLVGEAEFLKDGLCKSDGNSFQLVFIWVECTFDFAFVAVVLVGYDLIVNLVSVST